MNDSGIRLSHEEISLLLFALQGGQPAAVPDASSCEDACPVAESLEDLLCGGKIEPEQQLVRHLNNHVRDALMQSGVFELMATADGSSMEQLSEDQQAKLNLANQRLSEWSSAIKLNDNEKALLLEALSRMPRSAWLMMPRTLWKLKRKLKNI
jgi:hypothetical protein